jgi:hypothetical protein
MTENLEVSLRDRVTILSRQISTSLVNALRILRSYEESHPESQILKRIIKSCQWQIMRINRAQQDMLECVSARFERIYASDTRAIDLHEKLSASSVRRREVGLPDLELDSSGATKAILEANDALRTAIYWFWMLMLASAGELVVCEDDEAARKVYEEAIGDLAGDAMAEIVPVLGPLLKIFKLAKTYFTFHTTQAKSADEVLTRLETLDQRLRTWNEEFPRAFKYFFGASPFLTSAEPPEQLG